MSNCRLLRRPSSVTELASHSTMSHRTSVILFTSSQGLLPWHLHTVIPAPPLAAFFRPPSASVSWHLQMVQNLPATSVHLHIPSLAERASPRTSGFCDLILDQIPVLRKAPLPWVSLGVGHLTTSHHAWLLVRPRH